MSPSPRASLLLVLVSVLLLGAMTAAEGWVYHENLVLVAGIVGSFLSMFAFVGAVLDTFDH